MRKRAVMVQPEDTKTIPLPLEPVTQKRGRGRPAKEGALTNAQRQAAFRARRAAAGQSVTVTKKIPVVADGYDELVVENDRLREELLEARSMLESARVELAQARDPLSRPVGRKWSYRQITAALEGRVREWAVKAAQQPEERGVFLNWAFGAERLWWAITSGTGDDADVARLVALFDNLVTGNEK